MVIRPFRVEDSAEVVALWNLCGLVVPQNDPNQDIRRKLAVQPELFLVGHVDGRLAACVMAGYEGHRGWLNYLAVEPRLRHHGLGRGMVLEAERRLRAMGCPKINLQVRHTNHGVMEFYRRVGYAEDPVASMGKRLARDGSDVRPVSSPAPQPVNLLGQPVGFPVEPSGARPPPLSPMAGRYCTVGRLDPVAHAAGLWEAYAEDRDHRIWTYLSYGPFPDYTAFRAWLDGCSSNDPLFHVILDAAGHAVGLASYLRIQPQVGVIEVGHLCFSPRLQRTTAATEAMYLMMRRAFRELGYRRYEWKCDALNAASRRAALRLGFTFEGTFRQATIYKGRNRDTAWFSILDAEWPSLARAFEGWLDPANVDSFGQQRLPLSAFRPLGAAAQQGAP
jgi:RimJ/RimL family protein N-acetyltransferase